MHLPTFTPETIGMVDGKAELTGAISSEEYLGKRWIGENWIGYIGREGEPPTRGRWFAEDGGWRFLSENAGASGYTAGESLTIYEGYWGERAYMVLTPLTWMEQHYVAKKEGDHDHCDICWATIFPDDPEYFKSSEEDVVCPACYENFVLPRSLDFIEVTQG